MISFTRYDSCDTFARHMIVAGRVDFSIVSLQDEGCDSKLARIIVKLGETHCMERSDTPYYCSPSSETYFSR